MSTVEGDSGAASASASPRRSRLFVVLAGLYLAQSIPSYLIAAAIPPIMREQGVSRTAIGLIAVLMLPLVLKFLWAAQVDALRPIARAHRAGWIFITQTGTVLAIAALAFIAPTDTIAFIAIGMVISLLISTQDIATDGYAVRQLSPRDRPFGNAIQGGAVALGVVIGGTMSLVIYHHFGWAPMIWTVAAVSVLPLAAALAMGESDDRSEARVAPRPSLRAFWARPEACEALIIALVYRASEGLMKAMEGPYLVDRGVPLDIVGYLSGGAAATAGLIGSGLAAILMLRLGAAGVLTLLGLLRTLCFALFAAHALDLVTGWPALFGAAAFQTLIRYMEIVALYGLFMAVASKAQPGTDFTVLACAQLVIFLIGSSIAGVLADQMGYGALFALAAVLSLAAVIFTRARLRRQSAAAVLAN
ncbi:MAG: putative transrane transport protein [Xanthobacteraceae bacterium]|jgi:PAT family beta-lactamase induction signal transducer AmpG|nr:putative transrane transport protein [Xanthobacteraceae bacterium]